MKQTVLQNAIIFSNMINNINRHTCTTPHPAAFHVGFVSRYCEKRRELSADISRLSSAPLHCACASSIAMWADVAASAGAIATSADVAAAPTDVLPAEMRGDCDVPPTLLLAGEQLDAVANDARDDVSAVLRSSAGAWQALLLFIVSDLLLSESRAIDSDMYDDSLLMVLNQCELLFVVMTPGLVSTHSGLGVLRRRARTCDGLMTRGVE